MGNTPPVTFLTDDIFGFTFVSVGMVPAELEMAWMISDLFSSNVSLWKSASAVSLIPFKIALAEGIG